MHIYAICLSFFVKFEWLGNLINPVSLFFHLLSEKENKKTSYENNKIQIKGAN